MPPGSRHAVATIDLSAKDSNSAILQGFFFDSRHGMRRMLGSLVEFAVWNLQWSNVEYRDRFKLLAYFLEWHARAPCWDPKLVGENLYAVLFAAKFSAWLIPMDVEKKKELAAYTPESAIDSSDSKDVHQHLLRRANQVLISLSEDKRVKYKAFEDEFKNYLSRQIQELYTTLD